MQELRLVAVSEDGTYLVLATAGRGTRFTLPVDDRLRAAVRGNFSRLGQYEIEVESPLRPKEIQARIRAGETAEEIAATAGIPVERVRWFEGPVLQEREYVAQQAQRVAVRMPGESAPGPTLGELVAERLTRRGVPTDEIDWDSAKRDDGLWRVKLGYVWNGHTRHAEWLFDPRKRHVTPHDDEAMRLSSADFDPEPAVVEDTTVTPFAPRVAKLQPVPPLSSDPLPFPSVVRGEPEEPAVGYNPPPRSSETAYTRPADTPSREAPFDRDPGPRQDATGYRQEPGSRQDPGQRHDAGPRPDAGPRQEPPSREPFRPEPPARETGYARPGDTSSRRGGSSPWLPDFSSGRAGERDSESIYAPATPPASRPDPRPAPQPADNRLAQEHPTDTGQPQRPDAPETSPVAARAESPIAPAQDASPARTQPTTPQPTAHTAPPAPAAPAQPAASQSSEPVAPQSSEPVAPQNPEPVAPQSPEPVASTAAPVAEPTAPTERSISETVSTPETTATPEPAVEAAAPEPAATTETTAPDLPAKADASPAEEATTDAPVAAEGRTTEPEKIASVSSAGSPAEAAEKPAAVAEPQVEVVAPAQPEAQTQPEVQARPDAQAQPEAMDASAATAVTSATEPAPTATEKPAVSEDLAAPEKPAVSEEPVAAEKSVAAEEPVTSEEPAAIREVVTQEAAAAEEPVAAEQPAPVEQPVAVEEKAAEPEPEPVPEPVQESKPPTPKPKPAPPQESKPPAPKPKPAPAVPAARAGKGEDKDEPAVPVPSPPPAPAARPSRKGSRGRRASVPTWDEIMFGARRQD